MVVAVATDGVAIVGLTTIGLPTEWILSIESMKVCAESVVIGEKRCSLPTNGHILHLRIADPSIFESVLTHHPVRRLANGGYAPW
jgi:hypothetical protein